MIKITWHFVFDQMDPKHLFYEDSNLQKQMDGIFIYIQSFVLLYYLNNRYTKDTESRILSKLHLFIWFKLPQNYYIYHANFPTKVIAYWSTFTTVKSCKRPTRAFTKCKLNFNGLVVKLLDIGTR